MKYCPECRVEYEDWPSDCADCKVSLVLELPPSKDPIAAPCVEDIKTLQDNKVPVYQSDDSEDLQTVQAELLHEGIESTLFGVKSTRQSMVIVDKANAPRALKIVDELLA